MQRVLDQAITNATGYCPDEAAVMLFVVRVLRHLTEGAFLITDKPLT